MEFSTNDITVLGVQAKPYDFNGKKGTSYKADVVFNGGVATFKTTEEVYNDIKDQKNVECEKADFRVDAYKMDYTVILSAVYFK